MTALALRTIGTLSIERACEQIAACRTLDEAKDIADKTAAVSTYLRAQHAAEDAQRIAHEIALRAWRRVGEMLKETELSKGRAAPRGAEELPRLADLGITKKQSSTAQRLADLSVIDFEARITGARAANEKLNAAVLLGKGIKQDSESRQNYRTPLWFYEALCALAGGEFQLDAFADASNALCRDFYTVEKSGLVHPWAPLTFANPEFEDMGPIIAKALKEAALGNVSFILGPVGGSQEWLHKMAAPKCTIIKPDARINFWLPDGTPTKGADRDTDVFAFGGKWANGNPKGVFRVQSIAIKHLIPRKVA